ncbi:MAG: caspase family protein, partial [Proteobacteria bacterium]|nr:caspase family protein [Pseudomonadota bacterium]
MMKRKHSPLCFWLILLSILFLGEAALQAQNRAIRPVSIQIPKEGEVQLYKGSYALVIGVSDYQDNAWVDLGSVKADVDAVSDTLQEHGFVVQTVMNPTESVLLDRINEFIDSYGYEQENRLLFYYAGHGHTQERNGRKFGYLVPADAPNPFENEKEFFRKSLKMEQIISWAKQIESKHALFVFDSCFSGSVLQSRAITVPEDISYLTAKPVRQFLSAGSANQTVPAISVFRPLFIRGINGQADLDKDGYVTGVELGMYLQKQVPRYQTGQTPQYGKILDVYLDEGNFVFEVGNRRRPLTTTVEPIQQSKVVTLYISED